MTGDRSPEPGGGSGAAPGSRGRAKDTLLICPYCGETQPATDRCRECRGFFEPLSRQASHNAMGPWFVHDRQRPHRPGCSYETLARLIERGAVTKYTIIRGPTSKQFWTIAKHVPGIAHLLGYCHACDTTVDPDAHGCSKCGVPFGAYLDRNYLGLPEVTPLPWEAPGGAEANGDASAPGWTPPAMTRPSLSSFAADDELLGDPVRFSNVTTMTPAAAPGGDRGDRGEGAALRSMRRQLTRQRRAGRLLTVLLLAAIAIVVVLLVRTF